MQTNPYQSPHAEDSPPDEVRATWHHVLAWLLILILAATGTAAAVLANVWFKGSDYERAAPIIVGASVGLVVFGLQQIFRHMLPRSVQDAVRDVLAYHDRTTPPPGAKLVLMGGIALAVTGFLVAVAIGLLAAGGWIPWAEVTSYGRTYFSPMVLLACVTIGLAGGSLFRHRRRRIWMPEETAPD